MTTASSPGEAAVICSNDVNPERPFFAESGLAARAMKSRDSRQRPVGVGREQSLPNLQCRSQCVLSCEYFASGHPSVAEQIRLIGRASVFVKQ